MLLTPVECHVYSIAFTFFDEKKETTILKLVSVTRTTLEARAWPRSEKWFVLSPGARFLDPL